MSTNTGTLWVCGAATQGQFLSCPISRRVRGVGAAGRKIAATLEDGKVLFLDLERTENDRANEDGISIGGNSSVNSSSNGSINKFQGAVASARTSSESSGGLVAVPWTTAEHVPAAATALSGGSGFGVLLSAAGEVFTWGDSNKWGELGLGGRVVGDVGTQKKGTLLEQSVVAQATGSLLAKNIKHVAAGSAHAMAVSESGTLYAWGRGFEGQTGLVGEPMPRAPDAPRLAGEQTKPPGVVLSPKLVKFSSEQPVATVACGHNFTVAIVKQGGVLYAWGEGGCGQLGIGRCKKYLERPTPCDPSAVKRTSRKPGGSTSSAAPKFVDVSCGWAHVLARNANDEVYVWGLNAHGQLGLGHTDAVNHPVLLTSPFAETPGPEGTMDVTDNNSSSALDSNERPPLYLRDISAYGSGSAGVRPDGRVLSWGSNRTGRLGHPNDDSNSGPEGNENGSGNNGNHNGGRCFLEPKLVDGIAGQRISMVKLAAEELVAFAPTTLVRLEPAAGPMQGNSRFVISGSGLWASDNIVVKFEPVPSDVLARMHPGAEFEAFPRPRSTIGKFHVDPFTGAQTISCRTPNMADTQKSLKKLMAAYGGADGTGGAGGSGGDGSGGGSNSGGKSSAPSSPTKAPPLSKRASVSGSKAAAGSVRESKQQSSGALSPRGRGQFEGGPQPPHPQPMTISVSMNGIGFVPVGEKLADSGKGSLLREGKKSNKGRSALVSRDGESGSGSRAASHAEAVKKSLQLRSHGMGPELKHRLVYNFYAFAPFQLTTVHPRLLTLPPSASPSGGNSEPPVYLYIGGFGLYETNSIGVRLTAPGKKPIVCTATDVMWLEAGAAGEGSDPAGGNDDSPSAVAVAAPANNNDDNVEGAPSTGVYVRVKLNDVIRELDAAGSLPFETSSIGVALNGQDFLALQGARDDNSVMLYRAKLDSFYPFAVPAVAPPDPMDSDPNGFGVPLTLKGTGFFRADKRASCGDKTWHLKLRLADDPLAEPNSADSAAEGAAVSPGRSFERQPSLKSETSDALAAAGSEAGAALARQRRPKKAAPEVLIPCRFEDNFTLTALLPPFPLRAGYLQAFNRRARGTTKTGATPSSSFSSSSSASPASVMWPSPWPSVANFTTEIVMARDIGNLAKLWEQKTKEGVVALPPPPPLPSPNKNSSSSNDQFAPSLALESSSSSSATSAGLAPLCVYSLPGMGVGAAGPMALTLTRAAGSFACGQLVEFVPTDPKQIALFASAQNQPGQAKVRFAFCTPDGTAFVRSFPAAAGAAAAKELKKAPVPVPVEQDGGGGARGGSLAGGGSLASGSIAGSGGGNDFEQENASLGGDDFSVVSSVGGRAALGDPNDPLLEVNDDDDDEMRESKLAEQARRKEALQAYDDAQAAEAAEAEKAVQAASPLVWYVDVPATVECVDVLEPPVLVLPKPKVDPAAAAAAAAAAEAPPEKPPAKGKGKKPKVPQKSPEEEAAEAAAALAAATEAAATLVRAPPVRQKRWVVRCQAPGLARRMAGGVDFVMPDPESVNQPNNGYNSELAEGSGLQASMGSMSSPSGRAASSRAVSRKSARKQQEEDARLAAEEEAARARKRAPPEPWRGMPKRVTCRTFVALNGLHFHDWPVAKRSTSSSSSSFDGKSASAAGGGGCDDELVPVDHAAYLANLALFGDQAGGSMTEGGGSVASRGSAHSTATKTSAASAAPSAAAAASSVGGGGASLASSVGGGSLDGSFDEFANAFLYRGATPPLHTTVFTYLAYGLPNSVENVSTGGGALRPGSTLSFQGANLSCVPGVTCVRLTEMIYPTSDRSSEAFSVADDDRSVASSVASAASGHDKKNAASDGSGADPPAAAAAVEGSRSVVVLGVPSNEKGGGVSCVVPDFGVGAGSLYLKAELFLGGMGVVEARSDDERAQPTYTTAPLEYVGGNVEEEPNESAVDALQGEDEDEEAAAAP